MTHRDSLGQAIRQQWLLVVLVGIIMLSFVYAFTLNYHQTVRNQMTTSCINHTLALRQQYANADHQADVTRVQNQKIAKKEETDGVDLITSGHVREGLKLYRRGSADFQRTLDDYLAQIKKNDAERQKHPLGNC